jgi:YD repeat-containing protein
MVSIFTGLGAGLERGSTATLGASGLLGSGTLGRSGEQVLLNAATGNLLITQQDDFLIGRGPDTGISRTYNSLGDLSDENGDNWRQSTDRRIHGLTGTVNTTGSTIKRQSGDGSDVTYSWTASGYVATDGAGAYDRLAYSAGVWTWTDGDGQTAEKYELYGTDNWRITERSNAASDKLTFTYSGANLSRVTTQDGSYEQYSWTGNNITQIVTGYTDLATNTLKTLTRTRYGYDGQNRLTTVTVDLTPGDNSISDASTYVTTYVYDGTSKRVTSIGQSDGSFLQIGYTLIGADYRVTSLIQSVAGSATRTTNITYDVAARQTTIEDALGKKTALSYDVNGNLTRIVSPPARGSTAAQIRQFTYNSNGDVLTVNRGDGDVTSYEDYDSFGNWRRQRDAMGNTVERTFLNGQRLQTETRYLVADPDGAGPGLATVPQTSRYVYDALGKNLLYSISAAGAVTAYGYDGYGQQTSAIEYTGAKFSGTPTEAALVSWIGTIDRTAAHRIETVYDARGNVLATRGYSKLLASGAFDTSSEKSETVYIYDQRGDLLTRRTVVPGGSRVDSYTYDGLGRTRTTRNADGLQTTIAFADGSQTTTVTLANGSTKVSVFNLAGELLSFAEAGSGVPTATSTYKYDAVGRIRIASDPLGNRTYYYYDDTGRKVAEIDAVGAVTEYRYDAHGNVTSTTQYATKVPADKLAQLVDGSGNPTAKTLDWLRPAASADDRWAFSIYDLSGRLVQTIDGTGSTTVFSYDGASQLVSTKQYATRMSAAQIATLKAAETNQFLNPNDGTLWSYDAGMTVTAAGTIDGANAFKFTASPSGQARIFNAYLPVVSAGQTVTFVITLMASGTTTGGVLDLWGTQTAWGNASDATATILSGPGTVAPGLGASTTVSGLSTTVATRIAITHTFTTADIQVLPIFWIKAVTASAGDAIIAAAPVVTTRFHTASYIPTADAANDRVSRIFYDADGNVTGTLDAEGYLTRSIYDASGAKTQTIAYASPTTPPPSTLRATGTFADLLTSASTGPKTGDDIRNWVLYDAKGQLAAAIDGEGNLTRYSYTAQGELAQTTIGQKLDPATLTATPPTLATLLPAPAGTVLDVVTYTYTAFGQVLTETRTLATSPAVSTTTLYTYDRQSRLVSTTTLSGTSDPHVFRQRYDALGRLTSALGAEGSVQLAALGASPIQEQIDTIYATYGTTYTYDADSNLIAVTEAKGTATSAARTLNYYNADGSLIYTVNPIGEVTEYRYNALGDRSDTIRYANRISSTPLAALSGGVVTSTVTSTMTGLVSALDTAAHTDFNVDGTIKQSIDALSSVSTYDYNAFGELRTDIVPRDGSATIQTSRTYDRRGLLKTQVVDSASGGKAIGTTYDYDAFGRATQRANALGKVAKSTYDRAGRLVAETDALNNTTTYTYNARNDLVAVTDALLKVTRFVYDHEHRKIATIDALGGLTTTTYDAEGHVIATRDYLTPVNLVGLALDVVENNTTFTAALASTNVTNDRVTRYAYDKDGQLRFTLDGVGHVTEYVRDVRGNVIRTLAYDGTVTATPPGGIYSAAWLATQVSSLTSANNRVTRSVYDAANRLNYVIDALGQTTSFVYDSKGNLTRKVDYSALYTNPAGDPALSDMDTWRDGNVNATNDRTTRSLYDRKGQLSYSVDALGYVTRYEYDKLGAVQKQSRYEALQSVGDATTVNNIVIVSPSLVRVTQFAYDSAGRLTDTTDPEGYVTHLALDAMGQVTSSTRAYGQGAGIASIALYTYDDVGRILSETTGFGESSASTTAYVYNALGQMTQRTAAYGTYDASITKWEYDARGQVTKVTRGYGTSETSDSLSAYDVFGRISSSTDGRGSVVSNDYNVINELKSVTQNLETATADDIVTNYTYDNFGSVWKITDPRGNATYNYYDKIGRLTLKIDAESYATGTSYTRFGEIESVTRYENRITDTPVAGSPPALVIANRVYPSSFVGPSGWGVGFDPAHIVNAGSPFSEVYGGRSYLRSDFTATGAVQTASISTDANSWFSVTGGARLAVRAGIEGHGAIGMLQLAVNWRDINGNSLGTSYVGTLNGAQPANTIISGFVTAPAGAVDARLELYMSSSGAGAGSFAITEPMVSTTTAIQSVVPPYSSTGRATTWFNYDKLGRLVRTTDAENNSEVYTLNTFGERTAVKNKLGAITTYLYDKRGLVLSETLPVTTKTALGATISVVNSYSYDARGNRVQMVEANGAAEVRTTGYTYDNVDRLIATSHDAVTIVNEDLTTTSGFIPTETIKYDHRGNVIQTTDAAGASSYAVYDKLDRKIAEINPVGSVQTWVYDAAGNVTSTRTYATPARLPSAAGTPELQVRRMYDLALGRQPSQSEIDNWTYRMANMYPGPNAITSAFAEIIGDSGVQVRFPNASSSAEFVQAVYRYAFQREATSSEVSVWVANMSSGWTRPQVLSFFSESINHADLNTQAMMVEQASVVRGTTDYRQTSYAYDRANRLTSTTVASLLTGEWTGSAYAITSSGNVVSTLEYDKAGNVTHQEDGRGNDVYIWYDMLGRQVAQVDAENYLTKWRRDAEGNVLEETRFATRLSGFDPASAAPAGTSTVADRTTMFAYDKNGRRIQERRLSVAYTSVGADGVATDYDQSYFKAVSTVDYTYNGLGQVTSKTEASLADIQVSATARDTTTYQYDGIGRLTGEVDQAFRDYQWTGGGANATPTKTYVYDGLNNLTSSRVQMESTANDLNDRITGYTYDKAGRLATMTDAALFTHSYYYDKAGHMVCDSFTRLKSDGTTSRTEAQILRYDLAGRVVTQTGARYGGSNWVFTDEWGHAYDASRMRYNAYGDLTGRGITAGPTVAAVYQETFDYDGGGRLWRSNAGDGVSRLHLYDKAGNETLTIASAGAGFSGLTASTYSSLVNAAGGINATGGFTTTNAVTTVSVFDKRNQATFTRSPDQQLSSSVSRLIVRGKTYNAFGEVETETDPRGFDATTGNALSFTGGESYTTSFTYNTMGRLLSRVSPQVSVTPESGLAYNTNPTEYYGYDLSGRLVSVTDANGNRTSRLLLAGTGHGDSEALIAKEFHPNGAGVFETRYDVFGDARILRNELYTGSNALNSDDVQTFDKMGRLVSLQHRGNMLTDGYRYDGLGRRTVHFNSQLGGASETTDYDLQGRVTDMSLFGGDTTKYRYEWDASLTNAGLGDYDGWAKTTTNAGNVDMKEMTDYFGRTIRRIDFGGVGTNLTYDAGGRLVTQASAATTTYAWYNSGLQAGATTGAAVSTYRYDAAGNRTYEQYVVGGATYQAATATWDAMNRMTAFDDAGVSGGAAVGIDYEYDAAGNVRHMVSQYQKLDNQGYVGALTTQDYWYRYDSMNRFVLTKGMLVKYNVDGTVATNGSGQLIVGDLARGVSGATIDSYIDGTALTYDTSGQRTSATRTIKAVVIPGVYKYQEQKETYTYSADGYLTRTDIVTGTATGTVSGSTFIRPAAASGTGVGRAIYVRDGMGRVTGYSEYTATGYNVSNPDANLVYRRTAAYNGNGQLITDDVTSYRSDGTFRATNTYYYNAIFNGDSRWQGVASGGTYMGGTVTFIETKNRKNGWDGDALDTSTVNEYVWGDGGPVVKRTTFDTDTSDYVTSSLQDTWYTHDGSGFLTSAFIDDGRMRTITLVNDAEGRVLQRDEEDYHTDVGDPRELHYYFNGRRVGDIGNNGTSNTDYASSILVHQTKPGTGVFRNGLGGSEASLTYADFDQSYDAINGLNYESAASSYTVQAGDTISTIAQTVWGDASLWYLLAEANGLNGSETLIAGSTLSVPNKIHNIHNSAETWRPYDPNEAQGDLSPTAPKPAKKNCGVFGMILLAVIAVAVTAVTAGAGGMIFGGASNLLGGMGMVFGTAAGLSGAAAIGIGAVAGAVGSAVSQGIGIATGIQQGGFSWKAVALAGLSGALQGGLASLGKLANSGAVIGGKLGSSIGKVLGAPWTGGAIRGVTTSVVSQGIGRLTGLQDKFDWVGVAAAGVGGGVSSGLGLHGPVGERVSSIVGGLANAATRSLITGTDFGDNLLAAMPDIIGDTVGHVITDAITGRWAGAGAAGGQGSQSASGGTSASHIDPATGEIIVTSVRSAPIDAGGDLSTSSNDERPAHGPGSAAAVQAASTTMGSTVFVGLNGQRVAVQPQIKPLTAGEEALYGKHGYMDGDDVIVYANKSVSNHLFDKNEFGARFSLIPQIYSEKRDLSFQTFTDGNRDYGTREAMMRDISARQYEAKLLARAKAGPLYADGDGKGYFFAPDHPVTGDFTVKSRVAMLRASDAIGDLANKYFGTGSALGDNVLTPAANIGNAVLRYTVGPGTPADTLVGAPSRYLAQLVADSPVTDPALLMTVQSSGVPVLTAAGSALSGVGQSARLYLNALRAETATVRLAAEEQFLINAEVTGALSSSNARYIAAPKALAAGNTFTATAGRNTATIVLDADGAPIAASGNLQEYFKGATRGSAEARAQAEVGALGNVGDHGGHLVDHRFILDQGRVNIFPQEGGFNLSAYKTLGNDYARLIDKGYSVDFNHVLGNFDAAGRPGSLAVTYRAVDQQGVMVDSWTGKFLNQPGQVYTRRVH